MEEFVWHVHLGTAGEVSQHAWENDFGDGYSQGGGIGINGRSESWAVSMAGQLEEGEELAAVRAFLDRHEGYKPFLWRSPSGVLGHWRAKGYSLDPRGAGIFSLTATFKQHFWP
ncbi:phage tail protein [Stutzerimonas nitrititolerans]|uniref:phage tail protein n=1 Tax=Stutzerimonas nitrititolerans TaxID=2482751 RepID=UPI002897BE73|nr:phage tail protein [Stutzerimonas nitrititolerans]